MITIRRWMRVWTALVVLSASAVWASDIGHEIADQVSAASYQYFLDDVLYTHDGDDRGPTGPEHDLARDNIVATFESYGLDVELHAFAYQNGEWHNVVGTKVGFAYPDAQYIVGAHYDSVGNPGADDDASGVAGLLELARVFSQYDSEYTIRFIAFDLEERGLIGSKAYVADHASDDIRGMIQLDMIAWDAGPYLTRIRGSTASDPPKYALGDAVTEYGAGLRSRVVGRMDVSDHAPFEWAGIQACLMIETRHPDNPCYHRVCDSVDTPDYISTESLADSGD